MSVVPPYTTSQQTIIHTSVPSPPRENGPGIMPPNPYPLEPAEQWLPPPVNQLDIFLAQQTWPL